jgi:hypothetical protein
VIYQHQRLFITTSSAAAREALRGDLFRSLRAKKHAAFGSLQEPEIVEETGGSWRQISWRKRTLPRINRAMYKYSSPASMPY